MPKVPELEILSRLRSGLLIPDLGTLPPSAQLLMLGSQQGPMQLQLRAVKALMSSRTSHQSGGSLLPEVARALGFLPELPMASYGSLLTAQPPTGLAPTVPGPPLGSLLTSKSLSGHVAWIKTHFFSDPVSRHNPWGRAS